MSFQKIIISSLQSFLFMVSLFFLPIINAAVSVPSLAPTLRPTVRPSRPTSRPTSFEPSYAKFVKPPTPLSNNAIAARGIVLIIVVVIPVSIGVYCLYYFTCGAGRKSVNKVLVSMRGKGKLDGNAAGTRAAPSAPVKANDVEGGVSKRSRRDNQAAMEVEK